MTDQEFHDYLQARYDDILAWYDKRAGQNKWSHYGISLYLFAASAFLTAVSGLPEWKIWATLAAAGASIAAATLGLFKCQENWLGYRATWDALKREPHLRTAAIGEYASAPDKNALFVQRVEGLISREGAQWLARHSDKKPQVPAADASK
jgi:hypothetical protein